MKAPPHHVVSSISSIRDALQLYGRPNVFYFTGDTILVPGEIVKIREKYHVVILLASLGRAFIPYPTPESDPIQITMGGKDVAEMVHQLDVDLLVLMQYESWSHFIEGRKELEKVFKEKGILNKVI
ncbi:hypothetical protein QQX98_010130 [Neonectria punicea]|uniref:Uncharacterized protein n=1 Tax=Neonectria punicea TaxID=979145 RepID=A0ABR1GQJ3_9HYPO